MAGSVSPTPTFHLCPDFSIAPPPEGQHIRLGSVIRSLDIHGILEPLNYGATIPIPDAEFRPQDGPQEKTGFSRSLKELRNLEGSVWARIFGTGGPGFRFSFLRKRENDEVLTVDKLLVRYFIPTLEYTTQALSVDGVATYVRITEMKRPIYIVTGLMWTEGARLSKVRSKKKGVRGQAATTDATSNATFGADGAVEEEDAISSSFDGSTPFILGIRVRKIWWDKENKRRDELDVVGSTLGAQERHSTDSSYGMQYVDDTIDIQNEKTVVEKIDFASAGSINLVFV
ncbi:hypothetical protein K4K48_003478 [Colletotrichum sp. SAR 10_66]|nr:hypothetical protein K4K48_003478 [Colletotrichum sp. SAR 10_66]